MHLTPEEVMKYLEAQGFEFEDPVVNVWTSIFLADERVGTLYDDEVYLAQHMPSLFDGNYQSTSKSCIKYSESQAEEKLQSAIDRLKYSLREYEKEKRKQRVERLKEYFDQRNLSRTRRLLPGSVTINHKFVIQYMRSHGFEVKYDYRSEYPNKYLYYLRGELVGWSYDTVMYLQPVMPSLLKIGILEPRGKTEIPFDLPGIEMHKRLTDTVNELKNSYDSYDELVKKSRVQKVREYFKDREVTEFAKSLYDADRS